MKLASVLYVPPPKSYPSAILENLKRFPPKHRLIVYSEFDHKWPGQILLKTSPEILKRARYPSGTENRWALNNLVFLTGLRIAQSQNITHLCYVEADCRVGCKDWDDRIFDEYFNLGFPYIAAGSLVCYNPANWNREAARRWEKLVASRAGRNVPVGTYGFIPADVKHFPYLFPNGALSVLDMWWMSKLFNLDDTPTTAAAITAWDQQMGIELFQKFGVQTYDVQGFLETIYSGYGDVMTTPEERLQWLRDGKYVATHQHKGNETP